MSNEAHQQPRKTVLDAELRDLFAAAALLGLIPERSMDELKQEAGKRDELAKLSYDLADAMVRRRKANKDAAFNQRREEQPASNRGHWVGNMPQQPSRTGMFIGNE